MSKSWEELAEEVLTGKLVLLDENSERKIWLQYDNFIEMITIFIDFVGTDYSIEKSIFASQEKVKTNLEDIYYDLERNVENDFSKLFDLE